MSIQVNHANGPLGSASVVHMLTGFSPETVTIKALPSTAGAAMRGGERASHSLWSTMLESMDAAKCPRQVFTVPVCYEIDMIWSNVGW
jgi:hypothetical protein